MRRHVVTALALAGVLLVAGCDSGDPPTPEASTTSAASTPTATASSEPPGPVEPSLPADAKKRTKAGAEAFVRYYWTVVDYAQATGDVRLLDDVAGPDCGGCEGGSQSIRNVYESGGTITTEPYTIRGIELERFPTSSGTPVFTATASTLSGLQVIEVPGRKTRRLKPVNETFNFTLIFTHAAWRVDQLTVSR